MTRLRTSLLALLVAALLAVPAMAVAEEKAAAEDAVAEATTEAPTAEAPAAAPAAVITIPVLGSDLVVTVMLDGEGGLADVALDPVDAFDSTSAEHAMMFSDEESGVAVKVEAMHGGISTMVKTDSVETLAGPGSWSGEVFGATATVNYSVSLDKAGMPLVVIDQAGLELAGADVEIKAAELDARSGDDAQSTAVVEFTYEGEERKLNITAELETKDGETRVGLKITLTGEKPDDVVRDQPAAERPNRGEQPADEAPDRRPETPSDHRGDVRSDANSSNDRNDHRKDD